MSTTLCTRWTSRTKTTRQQPALEEKDEEAIVAPEDAGEKDPRMAAIAAAFSIRWQRGAVSRSKKKKRGQMLLLLVLRLLLLRWRRRMKGAAFVGALLDPKGA